MVATPVAPTEVEKLFLAWLPEIQSRAWAINHRLPPIEREECTAEVAAWSWAWMLAGARSGKIAKMTPRTLAIFASKTYACGRRFGGRCSTHDVMSESAKARGRVAVCSLDTIHTGEDDACEEVHRGFAILRPQRVPRPDQITRCRLDYGLVAKDRNLSRRAKDVFRRLVADHDRGCCSRIARDLKISAPYVHQVKHKIADALTKIGYGPHSQQVA